MKFHKYVSLPPKIYSRVIAKVLDYLFFYWCIVLPFSFDLVFNTDWVHALLISLVPILFVPLEALMLSTLGSTPGKALLGITVQESRGGNLSFKAALKRSFLCCFRLGFNLPITQWLFLYLQKKELNKHPISSWDQDSDSMIFYRKKRSLRLTLAATFLLLFSGLTYLEYQLKEVMASSSSSFLSTTILNKKENSKWVTFADPEGYYHIDFPKDPTLNLSSLPIPKSKDSLPLSEAIYLTEENVEFSISYTKLPRKWLRWSSNLVLKGALSAISSSTPGTKISKKSCQPFNKLPAIEFVFNKSDNKESLGRLVLVDDVLYKIEVSYPLDKKENIQEHLNLFLQSFEAKIP